MTVRFNVDAAVTYIADHLYAGATPQSPVLHASDIALFVRAFQLANGLVPDGMPGQKTIEALRAQHVPLALRKVWPLPLLPDMRKPLITSGFGPRGTYPDGRPKIHKGADMFYQYDKDVDPADVRVGDGHATRDEHGRPRYFIPDKLDAIAAAEGLVSIAGKSPTGWRLWIEHEDGFRTGYFHLRDLKVDQGQVVDIATPLGEVGDNPKALDAEHLHFETSPIGAYRPFDPVLWLVGATYHLPA